MDIAERFCRDLTSRGLVFVVPGNRGIDGLSKSHSAGRPLSEEHSHLFAEFCVPLSGDPLISLNGRVYQNPQRKPLMLLDGTRHFEACSDPSRSYRMLWGTLAPETIILHNSGYNPRTGYFLATRTSTIWTPRLGELWRLSKSENARHSYLARARCHSLLLENLCAFLAGEYQPMQSTADHHALTIQQVKSYIENYFWEDISLKRLAGIFGYSEGYLNTMFKGYLGMPIHRYLVNVRLSRAHDMLQKRGVLVKQAAEATGFSNQLYFSRMFRSKYGYPPSRAKSNS